MSLTALHPCSPNTHLSTSFGEFGEGVAIEGRGEGVAIEGRGEECIIGWANCKTLRFSSVFNITLPRFKIFFQYTVCTLYSINVQLIKEFDRYFFFLSSVSSVTVGWKVENVPMRFSLIFRNWTKICWTFRPNHPA